MFLLFRKWIWSHDLSYSGLSERAMSCTGYAGGLSTGWYAMTLSCSSMITSRWLWVARCLLQCDGLLVTEILISNFSGSNRLLVREKHINLDISRKKFAALACTRRVSTTDLWRRNSLFNIPWAHLDLDDFVVLDCTSFCQDPLALSRTQSPSWFRVLDGWLCAPRNASTHLRISSSSSQLGS